MFNNIRNAGSKEEMGRWGGTTIFQIKKRKRRGEERRRGRGEKITAI